MVNFNAKVGTKKYLGKIGNERGKMLTFQKDIK